MISFRLPNGAEFSFPVEWWNEAGPPMDNEGLDRVRMVKVLHAIVSRTALPPVEVEGYRWAIITIDYTTAHIASLRRSLLASRTFPPGCGSNSFPAIFRLG